MTKVEDLIGEQLAIVTIGHYRGVNDASKPPSLVYRVGNGTFVADFPLGVREIEELDSMRVWK
jgi:hypothetical protein